MSGVRTRTWAREALRLGQTWRRKRDGLRATVKMLHRGPDQQAEMVPEATLMNPRPRAVIVAFSELRNRWERVS